MGYCLFAWFLVFYLSFFVLIFLLLIWELVIAFFGGLFPCYELPMPRFLVPIFVRLVRFWRLLVP